MLLLLASSFLAAVVLAVVIRLLIIDKLKIPNIEDRVVLVTGAAGGFGRRFLTECLDNGMTVLAACHTQKSADKLKEEMKVEKGRLETFEMDIASEESVIRAKKYVVEQLHQMNKGLHAIVHNAAIQAECMMDDFLTMDSYKEAVEVNTYGPICVTKHFKDLLKKSKGRLIFCTSSICRFPAPAMGPYSVSKWALTGFTEVIRHELRIFGVDVITVEPGIFCTPLNTVSKMMDMMNGVWNRASQQVREEYGEYWFSRGKRLYIKLREASPTDVTPVSDAYFHAMTARCPYKNYVVGLDALVLFRPYSWLPVRIQELLMRFIESRYGAAKPASMD